MSAPRSLSPLAIVLIVSLIANALLVGLVLGNAIGKPRGDHGHRGSPGGGSDFMMARSLEDVVPEESRETIREAFRATFEQSRPLWLEKIEARRALYDALGAEPFEPAAVDAAFARMRDADDALTAAFQNTLADEVGKLTQDQRTALVDRLQELEERRGARRRDRRGDRRDGDRPPPGDGPPR